MTSVLLFLFMFLTCLMFLGMLWGDRLNFPGLFEGNWLNPISALINVVSRTLGEFLDMSVEFIVGHLSWVVAAVSGTVGLILIAFLMGGGLATDAEAYHRDSVAPLYAGGVVDRVKEVKPAEPVREIADGIRLAKADVDDSNVVVQADGGRSVVFWGPDYWPGRVRTRRPIDGSIAAAPTSRPLLERPELDVRFERLTSETLIPDRVRIVRTDGRLLNDLPDFQFVDRAVQNLLRDNWRAGLGLPHASDGIGEPDDLVPESPLAAVRKLESQIRVTPGAIVSKQDLRIEKTAPLRSATGEVTMQVTITNLAKNVIDGLLVRELLPFGTTVRGAVPEGILHDATLTWLVSDLRPQQERVLRFTVIPSEDPIGGRDTLFESQTEVSALAAVKTSTDVTGQMFEPASTRPPIGTRPPETVRAPKLRLRIARQEAAATVGAWTTVMFRITNIGERSADGVRLRLVLDDVLDHHALTEDDLIRELDAPISRILPGDTLDFELVVRPRRTGEAVSTAELLFEDKQLDLQTFSITTRAASPTASAPARGRP
ncbi:MAG: DUF11 domain-containing protein [Fuerstia sp.]|nr:DUF11 domain-containing protein [Fuerstiella sp.]